jgi:hypothetical protein
MPSPLTPADISPDNPAEGTTYFELELRRRGSEKLGGEPLTTPLPSSSPWSGSNPGPGPEPLIEGDSNQMNVEIDQLNR